MGIFTKNSQGRQTEVITRFIHRLGERTKTEIRNWLRLLVIERLGRELYAGDRTVSRDRFLVHHRPLG